MIEKAENAYIEKLRKLMRDPRFLKIVVFIGIAAMVLILLSSITAPDETDEYQSKNDVSAAYTFDYTDTYAAGVEKRLAELLEKIEGVGDVEVMVTVGGTEEYVFAEEGKRDSRSVVIIDGKSGKNALVEKTLTPKITGVVIVCEGGDDSRTAEKVYKTVSTALGLGASRIYVTDKR